MPGPEREGELREDEIMREAGKRRGSDSQARTPPKPSFYLKHVPVYEEQVSLALSALNAT